jgi:hypothetical protein
VSFGDLPPEVSESTTNWLGGWSVVPTWIVTGKDQVSGRTQGRVNGAMRRIFGRLLGIEEVKGKKVAENCTWSSKWRLKR